MIILTFGILTTEENEQWQPNCKLVLRKNERPGAFVVQLYCHIHELKFLLIWVNKGCLNYYIICLL